MNAANAFKLKTTNIGDAFCQAYTSVTLPGGQILQMLYPRQILHLSTWELSKKFLLRQRRIPPTSQYEVYYHIYAGQNSGVYYSIYLQRTTSSSYYQGTSNTRQIDSGYIAAGGYQDQTKDFTATSGYNQLCINVNGQIDCNFQSVSTSVALNAIKSQYLASEVNNTQITSESDCVSGTPNVYGLLNPNVQNGLTNAINPQIYNQGVTRICATNNPGLGTDPNANAQNSRWISVGTCGSANLQCWLDTQSVTNAINSPDIAAYLNNGTTQNLGNATLQSLESNYNTILQSSGYLSNDQYSSNLETIQKQQPADQINSIQNIINQVFYNNQKGYLYLLQGEAYRQLALQGGTGTSSSGAATSLHLSDGAPCIASFDCNSNFCDTSTDPGICKEPPSTTLGAATTGGSSDTIATCIANGGTLASCTGTSASAPAASSSGITANDLVNAMTYSQSNPTATLGSCSCGTNCQQYANSIINASNIYNEIPFVFFQ